MQRYLVREFREFYQEYRCPGAPENATRVLRLVEQLFDYYRKWLSAMEFMSVAIRTLNGVFARFDPAKYKRGNHTVQDHFVNYFKKNLWGLLDKTIRPKSSVGRLRARYASRDRFLLQTEWAKEAVREAVERLPEAEQAVIKARYWNDESFREMGSRFSKDHKTVKNWHDRIIDKLRDQLTA